MNPAWPLAIVVLLAAAAMLGVRRRLPVAVEVIAHRGASGLAPENTLAALRLAADLGAVWAEVDVQRTADGVLVLVHDDDWRRTTGLQAAVCDTPWERVRGLDAGRWFGARFTAEHPPSLDEVLAVAAGRLRLNLEIKSPGDHPGIGPEIVAAVRRHGLAGRVLLTSFDLDLVEALAASDPDLDLGYLSRAPVERRHPGVRTYSLLHTVVTEFPHIVPEAHARGCRVIVWPVDEPRLARRLAGLGVDGVVSNHPERLLPRSRRRL